MNAICATRMASSSSACSSGRLSGVSVRLVAARPTGGRRQRRSTLRVSAYQVQLDIMGKTHMLEVRNPACHWSG